MSASDGCPLNDAKAGFEVKTLLLSLVGCLLILQIGEKNLLVGCLEYLATESFQKS